jgi:hypothetical protein
MHLLFKSRNWVRRHLFVLLGSALLLSSTSCIDQKNAVPTESTAEYRPTGTIRDIMDSIVDPNSDYLWDSVFTETTSEGPITKVPKTDEEWAIERDHAIALMEASNLLQIPGRRVALPGEKAENPEIEDSPDEIQALIDADRSNWNKSVEEFYGAMSVMMKSIDASNPLAVLSASEDLGRTCEDCHAQYWYPHQFDKSQFDKNQASGESAQTVVPGRERPKKLQEGDL